MAQKEIYHNAESDEGIAVTAFTPENQWQVDWALGVLDEMFMERASISVDDWFRDSPNLFQEREEFKKRMSE